MPSTQGGVQHRSLTSVAQASEERHHRARDTVRLVKSLSLIVLFMHRCREPCDDFEVSRMEEMELVAAVGTQAPIGYGIPVASRSTEEWFIQMPPPR